MKKFIKNIALFASMAAMVGCVAEPADVVDSIQLNRCLAPTNLEAEIVASVGTDVKLTWDAMEGTEYYTVEVYESTSTTTDEEGNEVAAAPDFDAVEPFKTETNITEVPHIVSGLEVDKSYFVRVKGSTTNLEDSHWTVLEKAFATSAVRSQFKLSVTDRTASSVTVVWAEGEDAADLTTIKAVPVSNESKKSVSVELSDEQISTRQVTVSGLDACTDYKFTLIYGKACDRGSVTAWTRPSTEGATEVASIDALVAALTGATSDLKIKLAYNEGNAYNFTTATSTTFAPAGDLYIYGETTTDGKKPVITGMDLQPAAGAGVIHIEDVVLDGVIYDSAATENKGYIVTNKVGIEAFELINCEAYGFTKGLYSSSGAGAGCGRLIIDGVYAHDINPLGSVGGDFIDLRGGANPVITITNSTFYACARTFLRAGVDNDNTVGAVELSNCTFNFVSSTISASNNNGIIHVMVGAEPTSVVCDSNVFMNMYNDKEPAGAEYVRLVRNSTQNYAPVMSNNFFYNVSPAFLVSAANVIGSGEAVTESGDRKHTATGGTTLTSVLLDAENKPLASTNLLEADPCQSSGAGKLYLNENSPIAAAKAGDPRWWNAAIPEPPVRATELEVAEQPYTWDFTLKSVYDGETLNATTIIGNARIYASAEAPTEVKLGEGVYFAEAGILGADGAPMYGAIGILTEGYGAVVVTATGDNGVEGVQVMAGGDRYTVLADGKPHKVLFGDLVGQNNIYIVGAGGVTIKQIEWNNSTTPDATTTPLATPTVSFDSSKVDEGTAQAITATWKAVENADVYEVMWRKQLTVVDANTTTFVIPADEVAALAVGEYEISVVAKPVTTSSKWLASEAATAVLKVNKVVLGGEVTLTWDFSSDAWAATREAIGTADNKTYEGTTDGLKLVAGGSSIKVDGDGIRLGGAGNTTVRCFSFTAPANGTVTVWGSGTGSSAPSGRNVVCQVGESGTPAKVEVTTPKGELTVCTFDITAAGETVYVYTDASLNLYKIEYTYVVAPKAEYIWDFASNAWAATREAIGTTDNKTYEGTTDGLKLVAGGSSIKVDGDGIRLGGAGNTTIRCFSFTVPGNGTVIAWGSGTGSSAPSGRNVVCQVGESGTPAKVEVTTPKGELTKCEFAITANANDTVYVYTDASLNLYKIEYYED